ncbi:MAG TPA: fibronectin type III domain-containing protein [Candidatus Limnocylindrales bacterium]|nr:fibronectin type III domain-containing protein [Candidatus Limnocylindrales bacterium]
MGHGARESHLTRIWPSQLLLSVLLISSWCSGCASPGEPLERKAPVPAAITDLAAKQSGNTVVLTFTLPHDTPDHRLLKHPPAVEIYVSFSPASATAQPQPGTLKAAPALLVTIPGEMTGNYMLDGRLRYVDVLRPDDLNHTDEVARYIVRTSESPKKSSADSNVAELRLFPAPDPIDDLAARLGPPGGVSLTWTPPAKTPLGATPPIQKYRIYRAEVETPAAQGARPSAASPSTQPKGPSPESRLLQIGKSDSPSYHDAQAEYGKSYVYSVRSVIETPAGELESTDSNLVTIAVRDVIAPSTPQGLLVIFVPAGENAPAHLELSWAINPETDVAGYNVYRSEQEGTLGARLNPELLPTPAFRDTSPVAGRRYFYSVTAVDRSGNESSPSASVSGEIPATSETPATGQPNP